MFRFAIVVLVALLSSPSNAQRVFRAAPLDLEQNQRLDSLETRTEAVEQALAEIKSDEGPGESPALVGVTASVSTRPPVQAPSGLKTTDELRAEIASYRPQHLDSRGRFNPHYATVRPVSGVYRHLQDGNHGFTEEQVSGLSLTDALILHDLAPEHGGKISPYRNASSGCANGQCPTPVRSSPSSTLNFQSASGGCPNGQCPTQPSRSSGGRVRLFPRLFR